MSSGFAISEWLVLTVIASSPSSVRPGDLTRLLGMQKNTVSQMLARMVARKFMKLRTVPDDKRAREIVLLSAGRRALGAIESAANTRISRATASFSAAERKSFIALFSRYVDDQPRSEPGVPVQIDAHTVVRRLSGSSELAVARGFHLLNLVRTNRHASAPATLFAENSRCYGMVAKGEIVAVLECRDDDAAMCISNFSLAAGKRANDSARKFLGAVLRIEYDTADASTGGRSKRTTITVEAIPEIHEFFTDCIRRGEFYEVSERAARALFQRR